MVRRLLHMPLRAPFTSGESVQCRVDVQERGAQNNALHAASQLGRVDTPQGTAEVVLAEEQHGWERMPQSLQPPVVHKHGVEGDEPAMSTMSLSRCARWSSARHEAYCGSASGRLLGGRLPGPCGDGSAVSKLCAAMASERPNVNACHDHLHDASDGSRTQGRNSGAYRLSMMTLPPCSPPALFHLLVR